MSLSTMAITAAFARSTSASVPAEIEDGDDDDDDDTQPEAAEEEEEEEEEEGEEEEPRGKMSLSGRPFIRGITSLLTTYSVFRTSAVFWSGATIAF